MMCALMWCDMMWYDMTWDKKRLEWAILDAMSPQNINYPQEWEDHIVIEK